ncbi:MAG: SDR family oxidoreductase [Candidatus Didemnitutus sp.]|nr:SDR family oxidoreductase [Candidatus Didemnitutus sp.]
MTTSPDTQPDPAPANPPAGALALVTGGAGFIGSHLVDLLLQEGWKVRVLDNLSTGNLANLPTGHERLDFSAGDLRDTAAVRRACAGVDLVFHLAAQVSVIDSIRDPRLTEEVNIGGTGDLFEAAAAAGVRRLVFSSSSAVYGDDPELPKQEEMRPQPLSPYAVSKLAGENLGVYYVGRGLSTTSLRYFNVYGRRQNPHSEYAAVVPRFVQFGRQGTGPVIYGDGEQTRDFVHVSDVVRANLRAALWDAPAAQPAVFNVGTGQPTSINELWQLIARATGCNRPATHATARPGEIRHSYACTRRAREMLGFQPQLSREDGLTEMANAPRPPSAPDS